MQRVTADEFFQIIKTTPGTFNVGATRSETALAFGAARPLAGGLFLDLDIAAAMLVDELTPAFTRKFAATLIRGFFDEWCKAVGRVDTTDEPIFLIVIETGEPLAGKRRGYREHGVNVASATLRELSDNDLREARTVPERMTLINVSSVVRRAREAASAIKVDLSAPFCPGPDDPKFEQAMRDAKAWRERNVSRARATR
jgi:hypothetical protein